MGFYFNTYISYDTIFCLLGAVCLFLWFRELNIQSQCINRIAGYSFAAFIIHMSPFYGDIIWKMATQISEKSFAGYLFVMTIVPFLIYSLSMCLEFMRKKLFGRIENIVIAKITENKYVVAFEKRMEEFD